MAGPALPFADEKDYDTRTGVSAGCPIFHSARRFHRPLHHRIDETNKWTTAFIQHCRLLARGMLASGRLSSGMLGRCCRSAPQSTMWRLAKGANGGPHHVCFLCVMVRPQRKGQVEEQGLVRRETKNGRGARGSNAVCLAGMLVCCRCASAGANQGSPQTQTNELRRAPDPSTRPHQTSRADPPHSSPLILQILRISFP